MHGLLATLCAGAVAFSAPAARAFVAGPASGESAETLYEEGRKDYRLGRFKDAIEKWERAFALAELPLLLYNIALAYRQLYDVSDDVEDLRKGKSVLKNFFVLAERDPEVDASDAKLLMEEIDELIEKAEEAGKTTPVVEPDSGNGTPIDTPPAASGEDPGRTLRIAGAATMGAGGVFVLTGVALGIFYGLKGSDFKSDLNNAQRNLENGVPCMREDGVTVDCDQAISKARSNGRQSNLGMGLALGLGGGLGLAALATGAVLFVQGNRKSKAWRGESARIQVLPSLQGVSVVGRF